MKQNVIEDNGDLPVPREHKSQNLGGAHQTDASAGVSGRIIERESFWKNGAFLLCALTPGGASRTLRGVGSELW